MTAVARHVPREQTVRGVEPRYGLGPATMGAIVLSYAVDTLLLLGFALAGTIPLMIPGAYFAAALTESAIFFYLGGRHPGADRQFQFLIFPRVLVASAVQLAFIALVPQVGFYFISLLFIVFGFGSLGLTARQSALSCSGVALVTLVLFARAEPAEWIPHATLPQQALVWLCVVSTLGRCVLLGVFSRPLRLQLQQRRGESLDSVGELRQGDRALEHLTAELQHQATHDVLTGLANRVLFADRLEQAVKEQRAFAVCVLDLDRFRVINDSLGHGAGDALLKLVGRRLLSTTRPEDVVARAAGDEFLLLLREVGTRADVEKLAQRWMSALSEPYRILGTELHVSPSIGIARFPIDASEGEELLARADEAMFQAKQSGRNLYRLFDSEVMGLSRERNAIEADLRQALAGSQLQLHYQPKIDIASGETHSVEALLRWRHPTRGSVAPGEFLAIAEDSGLILPIGEWVMGEACRQARAWQLQGLPIRRVAVNVSATQFRQANFPNMVRAALESHSLHPSFLEIELTEATLMSQAEKSVSMLEHLSRLGVVVAIDDFGTGYSNMTYLQRFPIDKLKIDRSFICDLDSNSDNASIVRAIISLAHGLRLKVGAEGVETAAQLDKLRRLGCDEYQGFYRSAAVTAAELRALLTRVRLSADEKAAERSSGKLARLIHRRS
jgi:diguanylate cyclase (GGDEF)-like protein